MNNMHFKHNYNLKSVPIKLCGLFNLFKKMGIDLISLLVVNKKCSQQVNTSKIHLKINILNKSTSFFKERVGVTQSQNILEIIRKKLNCKIL